MGLTTGLLGAVLLPVYGGFAAACLFVGASLAGGLGATTYTRQKRSRKRLLFLSEGASYRRLRHVLLESQASTHVVARASTGTDV